jgi:hypothetical protein
MPKIDESRIVAYDRRTEEYAVGWKYYFYSGDVLVKGVTYKSTLKKLRWCTKQEQSAGEMKVDAADDGFKTRGCHEYE